MKVKKGSAKILSNLVNSTPVVISAVNSLKSQGDTGLAIPNNLDIPSSMADGYISFPPSGLFISNNPPFSLGGNSELAYGGQYLNMMGVSNTDIDELKRELGDAKKQLEESQTQIKTLQKDFSSNASKKQIETMQSQIAAHAKTLEETQAKINQAQVRSNGLVAPVTIPALDDMKINLVPTYWLERLEEYRSDESIASLLIGLFGGAFLGMFASLFTSSQKQTSAYAIMFLFALFILIGLSIGGLLRLHQRSIKIRNKMFNYNEPPSTNKK